MKNAELEHPGRLQMPRSRGAVSGLLLVLGGAWGALIPFVGPRVNFAFASAQEWAWTTARGWFEVLPGAAAVLGGLLLIASTNRLIAMFGGSLAVLAGAWFVVGPQVAPLTHLGDIGDPVGATERKRAVLELSYFTGLGVLIVLVGGFALACTCARLARDIPAPVAREASRQPVSARFDGGRPAPAQVPAEWASEAETQPRGAQVAPENDPRRWRSVRPARQRVGAARSNAYLRWPYPQG
ncbi:MAG: hypothetical protein K2X97_09260 [Mycobacteriaceae bacterium]|nr:hypothetical protein [Mycobacteriaceae bacterium]